MRIVIGTDSLHTPLTGVGRYTYELCKRLVSAPGIEQISGFDFWKFHSLSERLGQIEQDTDFDGGVATRTTRSGLRVFLSNSQLATRVYQRYATAISTLALGRNSDFVFHSPNFHLPQKIGKSVVTIHDLSYLRFPLHHPAARVEWMSKLVPAAVNESSHIICVSESSKFDLLDRFQVNPDKVSVTHLGVNSEFRIRSPEQTATLLRSYGLSAGEYFLCVSTIEPRKNLDTLINAYLGISKDARKRFPLVLVGGYGWKYDELRARLEGLGEENVLHLGFVSQDVLPIIYSGARCFVYPSFYEGFGLPVLEAQASGVPVICSNSSSLPEVASEEALMVHPEDTDGFEQAMNRALEDDEWLRRCSQAGSMKAAGFTWGSCAEATIRVYKMVERQVG